MNTQTDHQQPSATAFWAGTAVAALSTVLMLELTRVFASYLVFVVDQSKRVEISLIVLVVFVSPVLAGLIVRIVGLAQTIRGSAIGLAALALLLQFIETPNARIVIGGLGVACWGWLMVGLLSSRRSEVAAGLTLALALDVIIRIFYQLIDLPWMPDIATLITTAVLAGGLVFAASMLGGVSVSAHSGWRAALPLLAIGPGLAMFYLMAGNVALAEVWSDLRFSRAAGLFAIAMFTSISMMWPRFSRLSTGKPIHSRFRPQLFAIDMVLGTAGMVLFWSGSRIAELGLLLVAFTSINLLSISVLPSGANQPGGIQPVASLLAASMVVQFVILFLYYTATGSVIMITVAWILLLGGAALNTVRLSRESISFSWLPARQLRFPFAISVIVFAATVWMPVIFWSAESAERPTGNDITVISYNIQSGFSLDNEWDLDAIAETIEAADPDIVILQEVSRGWLVTTYNDELLWLSQELEMPYVWGPASNDDLWGNAILSKWPISDGDNFKYTSTQNLDRALVSAVVETPSFPVLVIGTHLDNPEDAAEVRFEQVDQLLEYWIGRSATIIAGDFNAPPDDPVIQKIIDAGLIDTGAEFGNDIATSETGNRIDYIFVSPDLTVISSDIPDSDASDHRPVVATMSLPLAGTPLP